MSQKVNINYFGGGMADDYVNGGAGEFSFSKQFDILGYPHRLQPLRGMEDRTEAANLAILNMALGANGNMYGIGLDNPGNPTLGELYVLDGFGASDVWEAGATAQLSGVAQTEASGHYDFLVHFPEQTPARKVYWASTNLLMVSSPTMDSSADSDALTFSTIGQGLVHPKYKKLYFPYQTSTASLIGRISVHATDPFGTLDYTAFEFPNRYRAFCLSHYGDYLAVPMTVTGTVGGVDQSVVGFWDTDETLTDFNETVPWGSGLLQVLNNVNGTLVGVSVLSAEIGTSAALDMDKIQIKGYDGGGAPYIIAEITATRTTTTAPSCVLNHRVNYVANNRLYFSANVINGDSDANYYGLWSVGRNKFGKWTVTMERVATNDNSETGIFCAAARGDFLTCGHTTAGTITYTVTSNTLASIYDATSAYESVINPLMPDDHKWRKKKLKGVYATYLPLPAAATIVMQYRADGLKSDSWTTAFTETTDSETRTEVLYNASKVQFPDFNNIEFRLTSVDGGIITGFGYVYDIIDTQL